MTSNSQCQELVNNNSSTCEISAKFELDQLEIDYLRRKNSCDNTSLVNNAYIKLNTQGQIIEHKCSTALPTLLKLYDKYNDDLNIDRFDCIGPSRSFYSVQNDVVGNTRHLPSRSKRILSMEEELMSERKYCSC